MDFLLNNVAGIDVHKEFLAVTILTVDCDGIERMEQIKVQTFTDDLRSFAQKLIENNVKEVAMESTGIYWKPIFNVLNEFKINVTLGNAAHMKNVPGRKTDMKDSHWIAHLHRCGLIKPSFIPDDEFQDLRLLTRHRETLVESRTRIKNRVQKILEDGNVKLSCVINDIFGVSGLEILKAIAAGEVNPKKLASKICTKLKCSEEEIHKALSNCLRKTHIFLIKELLVEYEQIDQNLQKIEKEIDAKTQDHQDLISRLVTVPGISDDTAKKILAESTNSMEKFASDRNFAAWAGVAPGNHESADKKKEGGLDTEIHSSEKYLFRQQQVL